MRAAQHGKSSVAGAWPADYLNPDYELNVQPIVVGKYRTEDIPVYFDVLTGDTCLWYPDDAVEQWYKRMEAEYGSREQW